ncbi:DNA adenine methylase [Leptotrichia sp. OH3620_COT-345]|uniref:DNA adenine methylase n=1 Tax=Leptotrichia sp. OH3620_COT-345 TaxID=2491048 RepID=UPI000F6499DF|nr:DNA adenine methylase [Leptotrichia sp. OH3620_COT-345]RRD38795.1 DNA adenine methylase [Leptotrichia sp. OH3620_COT-345]
MVLQRHGNKKVLFKKIERYIPEHEIYIEPFFGAGSVFFLKERAKYNFLNDLDNEVFNLFQVIKNKPVQFKNLFRMVPKHKQQFKYWKEHPEKIDTWQAVRFIYLTNFSFMATRHTMRTSVGNPKFLTLMRIKETFDALMDTTFDNLPYEKFIKNLSLENKKNKNKIFIYCDPPYINTINPYNTPKWGEQDLKKLVEFLVGYGERFMISEFNSPEVLKIAEEYKLKIQVIGERRNIGNRRTEIIIKNY